MDFECTQRIPLGDVSTDVIIPPNKQKGILTLGGSSYPVFEGSNKIGRDNSCKICIPNNILSKQHALIYVAGDSHHISDLESLNKTFVGSDEKPLTPHISSILKDGIAVRFGNIEGVYNYIEDEENDIVDFPTTQMVRPENPITLDCVFNESIEVPETPSGSEDESIINRSVSPVLSLLGSNLRNKSWINDAETQIRIKDQDLTDSSLNKQNLSSDKTTPIKKSSETLESPYFIEKLCLSESGPETFEDNKINTPDKYNSTPKASVFLAPETQSVTLASKSIINISVPETQDVSVAGTSGTAFKNMQSDLNDSDSNDIIYYKEDCHTAEINYEASQSIMNTVVEQPVESIINKNVNTNLDEMSTDCESEIDVSKRKVDKKEKEEIRHLAIESAKLDNDSTDCEDLEASQIKTKRSHLNRKRITTDSTDSEEDISKMKTQKFTKRASKSKKKDKTRIQGENNKLTDSEEDISKMKTQKWHENSNNNKNKIKNNLQKKSNSVSDSDEELLNMKTQIIPKSACSNDNKKRNEVANFEEDIYNIETQITAGNSKNKFEKIVHEKSLSGSDEDISNIKTQMIPKIIKNINKNQTAALERSNKSIENSINSLNDSNKANNSDIFNQVTQVFDKHSIEKYNNESNNSVKNDISNEKTQVYIRLSSSPEQDIANIPTQVVPLRNKNLNNSVLVEKGNTVNMNTKENDQMFRVPQITPHKEYVHKESVKTPADKIVVSTKETMESVLRNLENSFDSDNDELINILQSADADDNIDSIYCMQETEVIQDNDAMTTSTPLVPALNNKGSKANVLKENDVPPKKGRGKKNLLTTHFRNTRNRESAGRKQTRTISTANTNPGTSSRSSPYLQPVEDFMDSHFTEDFRSETSLLKEFSTSIPKKESKKNLIIPEKEFALSDEEVLKPAAVFKYKVPPKSKAAKDDDKNKSPVQNVRKSSRKVTPKKRNDEYHEGRELRVIIEKTVSPSNRKSKGNSAIKISDIKSKNSETEEKREKENKTTKVVKLNGSKPESNNTNTSKIRGRSVKSKNSRTEEKNEKESKTTKAVELKKDKPENINANTSRTRSKSKHIEEENVDKSTSEGINVSTIGSRPVRSRKRNSKYEEPEPKPSRKNKKESEEKGEIVAKKVTKVAPEKRVSQREKKVVEENISNDESVVIIDNREEKTTKRGGRKRQLDEKEPQSKAKKVEPEKKVSHRERKVVEENISDDESVVIIDNPEEKTTKRGGRKRKVDEKEPQSKAASKKKKPNMQKDNLHNNVSLSNTSVISNERKSRTKNHLNSTSNTSIMSVRSSSRIQEHEKYKILFTSMDGADALSNKVKTLGGQVVENIEQCTILVTSRIVRTVKFLCCLVKGVPIVNSNWINDSHKKKCFLDPSDYILRDKAGETKYKFNLEKSLRRVQDKPPLLQGYTVMATPNTIPSPADLKGIIEWCGGTLITKAPSGTWPENSLIVSTPEDKKYWPKQTSRKIIPAIVSMEAIMQGILQFNLNINPYIIN